MGQAASVVNIFRINFVLVVYKSLEIEVYYSVVFFRILLPKFDVRRVQAKLASTITAYGNKEARI